MKYSLNMTNRELDQLLHDIRQEDRAYADLDAEKAKVASTSDENETFIDYTESAKWRNL